MLCGVWLGVIGEKIISFVKGFGSSSDNLMSNICDTTLDRSAFVYDAAVRVPL